MIKDINILKLAQKAKELNDKELQNTSLLSMLLEHEIIYLNSKEKDDIIQLFNDIIIAKNKANLSS